MLVKTKSCQGLRDAQAQGRFSGPLVCVIVPYDLLVGTGMGIVGHYYRITRGGVYVFQEGYVRKRRGDLGRGRGKDHLGTSEAQLRNQVATLIVV